MGGLFGGGQTKTTQETTVRREPPTAEEKKLTQQQIEAGEIQLGVARELKEGITSAYDWLIGEIEGLGQRQQEALEDPRAQELEAIQMDIIRRGGQATPEEKRLIQAATESALAQGRSDIESFAGEAMQQIANVMAPARGLRPSDTPIIDRASLVAREATRQYGQLERGLRGVQAEAELNFPLARGQFVSGIAGAQQQFGQAKTEFSAALRQAQMENQFRLASIQQSSTGMLLGLSPAGTGGLSALTALRSGAGTTTGFATYQRPPDYIGGISKLAFGLGTFGAGGGFSGLR